MISRVLTPLGLSTLVAWFWLLQGQNQSGINTIVSKIHYNLLACSDYFIINWHQDVIQNKHTGILPSSVQKYGMLTFAQRGMRGSTYIYLTNGELI